MGSSDARPAGSEGGEESVTLTRQNMPNYTIANSVMYDPGVTGKFGCPIYDYYQYATAIKRDIYLGGSNEPHNNIQPYLSIYMWKRIE
uniref:Baseplate protein n=1 Tax=Siphoviridae sp. ctyvQ1 TaxID=2826525 RepID=A0A8S5QZZ3_9CAUD|nr:MAG TPA: baseplate protein [Siphoviridae sp. ctyvQ1]